MVRQKRDVKILFSSMSKSSSETLLRHPELLLNGGNFQLGK